MVVARRQPDKPGSGVVFLAPVKGRKATEAAATAGLSPASGMSTSALVLFYLLSERNS